MSDFEEALRAVAKVRGISVDALKQEMLEKALGGGASAEPPKKREETPLARTSLGDASGASLARMRADAIEAHRSQSFPGSPVVRYERDDDETAGEAQERWYAEEKLPEGVHGLGGQTAGGIFGNGAIATSSYDPESMGRTDQRVGQMANIKMLGLIERLEQRLIASEARSAGALPPGQQNDGALPGASARRLGRGKR